MVVKLAVKSKEAVKVAPKNPVTAVHVEPELGKLTELAQEYAVLSDRVDSLSADPAFARLDAVKKELLQALALNYAETETGSITTPLATVEFSACAKETRKISNKQAVYDALGKDAFIELASLSVTAAGKYLSGQQMDEICDPVGYTKNRKLNVKHK